MPRATSTEAEPSFVATELAGVSTQRTRSTGQRRIARTLGFLLGAGLLSVCWIVYWMRVEPLQPPSRTLMPQPTIDSGHVRLLTPGYVLTAELTAYEDELFAFLMFDHLRSDRAFDSLELRLQYDRRRAVNPYRLILVGGDDLINSLATVRSLQHARVPGELPSKLTPSFVVRELEKQTDLFVSAYNLPVRQKLETLPRKAVENYLRRFIRFKSSTDPRIRRRMHPMPQPLTSQEAQRLAGDIITIAEFYSIPLEFLLGIGAMENNYMNVRGDLNHSIWKRKPAADDIILERRRGRVRILNDSAGVWQITRETLRFAHSLYRKDTRDYSALPEHLRPPDELRINEVSPHVLTTYAGLILRELLDRFQGNLTLAVSAYNGGPARPNLRYGEGVHRAASHARRVLEQAAALNGESVVNMTWIRRP